MKKFIAVLLVILLTLSSSIYLIKEKTVDQNKSRETFKCIINRVYYGDDSSTESFLTCSFDCVDPGSFTKETTQNKIYYVHKFINGDYCYVEDNDAGFVFVMRYGNDTVKININWVPDQIFEWNDSVFLRNAFDLYCVDLQNKEVRFFMTMPYTPQHCYYAPTVYTEGKTMAYSDRNHLYIINDKKTIKHKINFNYECIGIISDKSVLMYRFVAGFVFIYEYNFKNHLIKNIILCEAIGEIGRAALSPDKNYLIYTVLEGFITPPTLRLIDLKTHERLILDNALPSVRSLQFV